MYRARPALQPHQIVSHSHLQPLQNSAYYFKIISENFEARRKVHRM